MGVFISIQFRIWQQTILRSGLWNFGIFVKKKFDVFSQIFIIFSSLFFADKMENGK